MVLTSNNVTESVTSYNYPTQLITLTNLTSGTTYNYCVVAVNMTDVMQVGDPVCGNFTTAITAGVHWHTVHVVLQCYTRHSSTVCHVDNYSQCECMTVTV